MKDIKKIIQTNSSEEFDWEKVDWEAVETQANEQINGIVAKQVEKATEKARDEVIGSLEIEGVKDAETLRKHIESLSSGDSELSKQLEALSKEKEDLESKFSNTSEELNKLARDRDLLAMGVADEDTRDYLLYNVSKRVAEDKDWGTALKEYKEEKPQYFETRKNPTTTGASVNDTGVSAKAGWEKILEERHPHLKDE